MPSAGGIGTRKAVDDVRILDFMRRSMAAQAGSRQPYLLTVCTSAALAARAGLLDGKKATTNKAAWAWATSQGQATAWQKEARWVEDGHVWTSAGVTAGRHCCHGMQMDWLGFRFDMAHALARHGHVAGFHCETQR